jgi:hypothetical protein
MVVDDSTPVPFSRKSHLLDLFSDGVTESEELFWRNEKFSAAGLPSPLAGPEDCDPSLGLLELEFKMRVAIAVELSERGRLPIKGLTEGGGASGG